MSRNLRVIVDGLLPETSGIGVMQRQLYPRLEEWGLELHALPSRTPRGGPTSHVVAAASALLRNAPPGDVRLALVPPFPLRSSLPSVGVVHDLRWRYTRGALSRVYRWADVQNLLRQSTVVVAVSERTRADLESVRLRKREIIVIHSGPGSFVSTGESQWQGKAGRVLLVGGDSHKRNELAIAALQIAAPTWASEVVGIGVSRRVRTVAEAWLGPGNCLWRDGISLTEMNHHYRTCETLVLLSISEGFGFPYIEALSAGMFVVAIDQAITRELGILQNGALLVDGDEECIAAQLRTLAPHHPGRRQLEAMRRGFSWEVAAEHYRDVLLRAVASS